MSLASFASLAVQFCFRGVAAQSRPEPLVAALPNAVLVRPPGDHVTTLSNPELCSSILAFLRSRDL